MVSSKDGNEELQECLIEEGSENSGHPPMSDENIISTGKAIGSCVLYSFCSVSMVLVNKSLASR